MDIHAIPDIFQSKLRIAIVTSLLTGTKTFKELKILTGATDGNISSQMSKLKTSGYIEVNKDFDQSKPRTRYTLTYKGRQEFEEYIKGLNR